MAMGITLKNSLTLLLGVGLTGFWISTGLADGDAAFPMPEGKQYVNECGSCHTAYAPGLLPARSWNKLMAELDQHFGEDASLDDEDRDALLARMLPLAADGPQGNALMRRIASRIPGHEVPLRISTSPFFKYMHDEMPGSVWKRKKIGSPANCAACHTRTEQGRYTEREVQIPK